MGVSSGGGSVMHQLTAYGGLKPVAFQRAIPQSSGFVPTPGTQIQEETYAKFLSNLNVSSIEAARTLPSNELLVANAKQVGDSFWGTFTFGPVVDNDFVPGPAAKLLMQGSYAKHVAILSSHTANEGLVFTDPRSAGNNTHLRIQLRDILPTISEENQDFVLEKLYPPVYNGSKPWKDPIGRVMTLIGELALTCNTNAMAKYAQLHGTPAFHFDFSVPPALHGDDQPYTFARGSVPGMDPEIASIIQNAIAGFVMRGIPARSPITKASVVPAYGSENKVLNLAVHDTAAVKDPESNERCEWWHKALYY
ncbi:carboxylesterase family protein [Pochonia chlamydosporia 170]|uniref:Carboxylesterase family protein n=1 Tax=Pochonia chlamydosporia 170 TaxID=1380566 RepID=A0A179F983_METCM|nr:carboxylesterase family protein [Pochonia chlamydosporia 170]OAQ61841.2 carboxylesterase family protein [Pochonia chlamydosporia 170]